MKKEVHISEIPCLLNISEISSGAEEDTAGTFRDGCVFDFDGKISVNTTQVNTNVKYSPRSNSKGTSATYMRSESNHHNKHYTSPPSILRSSPATVTSDVIHDTGLAYLNTNMGSVENKLDKILALTTTK